MSKLYRFHAKSSLTFKVVSHGRQMTIGFSSAYRGTSTYFTTDEELAAKIRAHKWFKEGRIKEIVQSEEEIAAAKAAEAQAAQRAEAAQPKAKYSIFGKRFTVGQNAQTAVQAAENISSNRVAAGEDGIESNDTITEVADGEDTVGSASFDIDTVGTFFEAQEYMVSVLGIERSAIRSKTQLAEVCAEKCITFPNYDPNV